MSDDRDFEQEEYIEEIDENGVKVSKYQVDRRRKQAQLKRQIRKSKQNIKVLLIFSFLFYCFFRLLLLIFLLS